MIRMPQDLSSAPTDNISLLRGRPLYCQQAIALPLLMDLLAG